jgi:hypothetical protein
VNTSEYFSYNLSKLMFTYAIEALDGEHNTNQEDCHKNIDGIALLCEEQPEQAANALYAAMDALKGARAELLKEPKNICALLIMAINSNFITGAVEASNKVTNVNLRRVSAQAFNVLKSVNIYSVK